MRRSLARRACLAGILLALVLSALPAGAQAGGPSPPGSALPGPGRPLSVAPAMAYCRHHHNLQVGVALKGFALVIPSFGAPGVYGVLFGTDEVPVKAVYPPVPAPQYGGLSIQVAPGVLGGHLPDGIWTHLQGLLVCERSGGAYMNVYSSHPVRPPPPERLPAVATVLTAGKAADLCRGHPQRRIRVRVRDVFRADPRQLPYFNNGRVGQLPVTTSVRYNRGERLIPNGMLVTVHGLLACQPYPPTVEVYSWHG